MKERLREGERMKGMKRENERGEERENEMDEERENERRERGEGQPEGELKGEREEHKDTFISTSRETSCKPQPAIKEGMRERYCSSVEAISLAEHKAIFIRRKAVRVLELSCFLLV